jgi:hypothetical protein
VAEKIREQDHELRPGRDGGALLVTRLAAGDVPADPDPELGEDFRDVPQPVRAYEQRIHVQSPFAKAAPAGLARRPLVGVQMIMILNYIASENDY